jgi:hypothetical protein
MARAMSEILSGSDTAAEAPATRETAQAPERETQERPESAPKLTAKDPQQKPAMAKVEPKSASEKPAHVPVIDARDAEDSESDDDAATVPDSLDGLKRALAAARGDKRKARKAWRDTEMQLAELRGRLEVMQRGPQTPKVDEPKIEAPKPPTLDEDGFYSRGPEAVREYLEHRLATERESWGRQVEQRMFLDRSEARAMARHEDYNEKLELFRSTASPAVVQQMLSDHDPAEYVYEWASTYAQVKDTPSIEALRDKLREEIRQEMAASQPATQADRPAPQPPPRSIASARGTGVHVTQQWSGPRPMSQILGQR